MNVPSGTMVNHGPTITNALMALGAYGTDYVLRASSCSTSVLRLGPFSDRTSEYVARITRHLSVSSVRRCSTRDEPDGPRSSASGKHRNGAVGHQGRP